MDELKNIYNKFTSIIPIDFKESLNFKKFKNATTIAAALSFALLSSNIHAASNDQVDNTSIQTIQYNLLKGNMTFNDGYYKSPFSNSILHLGEQDNVDTQYEKLLVVNNQKKNDFKVMDVFDMFSANLDTESDFLVGFYDTLYKKSDNDIFENYKKDSLVNISSMIHLISQHNMDEEDINRMLSTDNNYFKSTSNINLTIKAAILNNLDLLQNVKSYEETFLYADIISEKIQRALYDKTEKSMKEYIKHKDVITPLNLYYSSLNNSKGYGYTSGNIALDQSIQEYFELNKENIVFKSDFIKDYMEKNPSPNSNEKVYNMMNKKKASLEYDKIYNEQNKIIKDEISKIYNEKIKNQQIVLEQINKSFSYFDSSDLSKDIRRTLKETEANLKNDKVLSLSKLSSRFK